LTIFYHGLFRLKKDDDAKTGFFCAKAQYRSKAQKPKPKPSFLGLSWCIGILCKLIFWSGRKYFWQLFSELWECPIWFCIWFRNRIQKKKQNMSSNFEKEGFLPTEVCQIASLLPENWLLGRFTNHQDMFFKIV
jgi:hypothetical protein